MNLRVIRDGALPGPFNMAADDLMLRLVSETPMMILRLYRWSRPTASLGRSQPLHASVDLEFCRQHGVDIVRRPTGGQVVLHDDEITYSFASSDPSMFEDPSPYGAYRRISAGLVSGFARVGLDVEMAPRMRRAALARRTDPCFLEAGYSELLHAGRKIAGSAQRRFRGRLLQHGSILTGFDPELLAGCTRADAAALRAGVTSVQDALGTVPPALDSALIEGIAEAIGALPIESHWSSAEIELTREIAANRYATEQWTFEATPPLSA